MSLNEASASKKKVLRGFKMKRFKLSKKASRKNFMKGATFIHKKNVSPGPMRGGIRL